MATLHISEAEAARDFSLLLKRVRDGDEVYIGDDEGGVLLLSQPDYLPPGIDVEYDAMISAKIEEALADPRPPISSQVVEAYFAKRKQENRLKGLRMAG